MLLGETAECHGELKSGHRMLQSQAERRDTVRMNRLGTQVLPGQGDRGATEQGGGRVDRYAVHHARDRIEGRQLRQ